MKKSIIIKLLSIIILIVCLLSSIVGCTCISVKENLLGAKNSSSNIYESYIVGRWDFEELYTDVKESYVKSENSLYIIFDNNYTGKMVANGETLTFTWEFIQCKENVAYFRFVNQKNIAFFAITPIDDFHTLYNKLTVVLEDSSDDTTMFVFTKTMM